MGLTYNQSKKQVNKIVKHYEKNSLFFSSNEYKEAQARQELIDPFFGALGWDMNNERHVAPQYREVITEATQKVDGSNKAPDYVFRIGREAKFFTEAKKPGISIKNSSESAFQLRRYAWSAKLPVSLLTDFEELAVYNGLVRPSNQDKASVGRINYFTYQQYMDCWRDIWDVYSRDAVWSGSFDQFVQNDRNKKGTAVVDKNFLEDIENWRMLLTKNILLRNKFIGPDNINDLVQRTIDRIIFLRMAEGRKIEPYAQLHDLMENGNVYNKFMNICIKINEKYNSGLFDFNINKLPLKISIDDQVFKSVISSLYFPKSPYEFSVFPVEMLGNVYEQFIGKQIKISEKRQVAIEDKPEVKKAGGVFYTPAYIVDYIVKNTVGKYIENKTPKDLKKMKVIDISCGSGSFLIGAYQFLMDYYLEWYTNNNPLKHRKAVWKYNNEWRLTISEKKRILTTHIYGVDIDRQAVEVTKLSLLLKVLDNEVDRTLSKQVNPPEIKALPNLSDNIKCGNSLIGTDYFKNQSNIDKDEIKRVNPFDWDVEFPDAMKEGGFDCVIGNPPYGASLSKGEKSYLENYRSFEYQFNSFVLFIEKGTELLSKNGFLSYITPAVFLSQHYFKNIREIILKKYSVLEVLLLNYKVFIGADTGDTSIFLIQNSSSNNIKIQQKTVTTYKDFQIPFTFKSISQKECLENMRYDINVSKDNSILKNLKDTTLLLEELARCTVGIKPYQKGKGFPKQNGYIVENRKFDSLTKETEDYRQYLIGKDIDRYIINPLKERFIKYGKWLAEPRYIAPFEKKKIILRQTADVIRAVIDSEKYYNLNNIYNIEIINPNYSYEYLLGILNSKIMIYIYQNIVPEKGKLFAEIKKINLNKLPIPKLDLSKKNDKINHDRMVVLVDTILDLNKKLPDIQNALERTMLERQIQVTNTQIDQLNYKLYNLTNEDIKIIEKNIK